MTKNKEDLGIKIGSKKEKLWTDVLKESTAQIESLEQSLIIQKEIKKLAEKKIAEEKEKFK